MPLKPMDSVMHFAKGKNGRGIYGLVRSYFDSFFVSPCSYLLPDKNRSSKQKTPVMKRTVNPVWNYTFVYDDVSLQELSERALELTIWDHDRLSTNEFLGGIRFSLGTGMELILFRIF